MINYQKELIISMKIPNNNRKNTVRKNEFRGEQQMKRSKSMKKSPCFSDRFDY